ncbi:MAG: hypothetical protein IJ519_00655, partial [Clostridia bacterium]|nr:hypothetical protein [Clostridia bacterium]
MKKTLSIILAILLCVSLCACSGGGDKKKKDNASGDDAIGMYVGMYAEMFGETTPLDQVYEDESYIDLKSGSKCTFTLDGDVVEGCTWSLKGDELTISLEMEGETESLTGTLKDGVIVIDMMGIPMTFAKEGADVEMPTGGSADNGETDETEDSTDDDWEFNTGFPTEEQI